MKCLKLFMATMIRNVYHLQPSSCCNYTRGHNRKLFKLQSHLDLRKNAFTVRVVSKWNSLPADVVNAPSVDAFKSRLDEFWLNQEVRFNYKAQFDYRAIVTLADPGGGGRGHAPLAAWASTQNALKVAIFRLKNRKKNSREGQCPLPDPS